MFRLWHCLVLAKNLTHACWQIVVAYYKLLGVSQPMVSIFGSARMALTNRYAEMASQLARMFAEDHISVITGGGTGIMEAASCGVTKSTKSRSSSIGISVRNLKEEKNSCLDAYIVLDYFFARKWLLTHYSKAFIFFPGGFGTMDELAEVLTLINTRGMAPIPIVLIGVEFWTPMITWLKEEVLSEGYIQLPDVELFVVTDDIHRAFEIAKNICNTCKDSVSIDKGVV